MNDLNNITSYYQKSTNIAKISRYAVTFLFIIFLLFCIFIFGSDITAENIQLLAKYITLNDGSASLYTDRFSITADDDSDIFMLSDNLVIVKHNNISLYDLAGQKLFSYDFSYSLPSFVHDDRNVVIHDISGNELSLFNTFSKIKSIDFPSGVTSADVNSKGIVAVSCEESFRASLSVFNSNYKEIYKWLSSENYITDAVLSNDGRYVYAVIADANEGAYSCSTIVLDVHSESVAPLYKAELYNELPVQIGLSSNRNSVYVITDSNIHFYDENLNPISTYKFNQSKIENYFIGSDFIILTERNNLSGNSMSVTGISMLGDKLFEININDDISDIAIGKNKFFALGKKEVYEFSRNGNSYKVTNHKPLSEKFNHIVCDSGDNCYIASNSKVVKINFEENKESNK